MCAVSVIIGYMQDNVPPDRWRSDDFRLLEDILAKVKRLDDALGQPDCTDPEKAKYLENIRRILWHVGS